MISCTVYWGMVAVPPNRSLSSGSTLTHSLAKAASPLSDDSYSVVESHCQMRSLFLGNSQLWLIIGNINLTLKQLQVYNSYCILILYYVLEQEHEIRFDVLYCLIESNMREIT